VPSLEPIVEEAEDPSPSDKQIVIQGFHSKHGVEISELIDESNLTSPDVFEEEAQDQTKVRGPFLRKYSLDKFAYTCQFFSDSQRLQM
jgi:hypothetical protein